MGMMRSFITIASLIVLLCGDAMAAPKPKPAPKTPAAPETSTTGAGQAPAVADPNDLSMRINALQTMYELDLSTDQLKFLRGASITLGQKRERTQAKSTAKLTAALNDLHQALLKQDGSKISELKEKVDELQENPEVDLDDDVKPTDAARARAPDVLKHIKASQIAAYLAEHADEVADPVEQMMDALLEIREADAQDVDGEIEDTSNEVGRLVAGLDSAKAKQIAEHVTAWLQTNKSLKDDDFAKKRDALEESARRIAGEAPPMQVLSNWMETELAELLSNPQLPAAIEEMLEARANPKP
jgi:hypothetical protein